MNSKEREIKFRAYDTRLKMWCYGGNGFTLFGEVLMVDGFSSHFQENPIKGLGSLDRIYTDIKVMQFTGLKDKNGKDIFEGDRIRYSFLKANASTIIEDSGEITVESIFQFDVMDAIKKADFVEVIGNIYENPSLTLNPQGI